MRANSAPSLGNNSLTIGNGQQSSSGGGIKKTIASVTKPDGKEEDKTVDSKDEKDKTVVEEEAGKKSSADDSTKLATTVSSVAENKKAAADAVAKNINISDILSKVTKSDNKEAWTTDAGAQQERISSSDAISRSAERLREPLVSIGGARAIPDSGSNKSRIDGELENPNLQSVFDQRSGLIGGHEGPSAEDIARSSSGAGDQLALNGAGGFGGLNNNVGGGPGGAGAGNNFNNGGIQIGTQINQVGPNIGGGNDTSFNNSITRPPATRGPVQEEDSLEVLLSEAEVSDRKSNTETD